jgi:DNA-binding SARP family transcriptional activator
MRFSLLGPLVVVDDTGNRAALADPRLRVMLAALLLHANIPVSAGDLPRWCVMARRQPARPRRDGSRT